jgi:asparagine synthase (glutamine-hydrolysing)
MDLRFLILSTLDGSGLRERFQDGTATTSLDWLWSAPDGRAQIRANRQLLVFPGDTGVAVGPVFRRHGWASPVLELDYATGRAAEPIEVTDWLERFWGNYIGLWARPDEVKILRAPMGQLPSYYVEQHGLIALASDPDLLCEVGLYVPEIDWGGVRRHLVGQDLPTERTGLLGLRELMPGNVLTLGGGRSRIEQVWSPWSFAAAASRKSKDPVEEQIRRTIMTACAACASPFRQTLLGVSGGLDSSVIAASLAAAKAPMEAVTLASDDAQGDERDYARILCSALGLDLHEAGYDIADVDLTRSLVAHRPRPCGRTHEQAYHAEIMRTARRSNSDAFMTGNGGDNVFYNSQSARAVADRFISREPGIGLVETIRAVCTITQCSLVQAIWAGVKAAARVDRRYRWTADTRLLDRNLVNVELAEPLTHPWLVPSENPLPGKAAHVAMLLRMQHHLEGYDRRLNLPVLNPLASQPVVELCLSIPTWEIIAGGRNRAVVRAAFSRLLPSAITRRTLKGGPDSFAIKVIEQNLGLVRERLFDGHLARRGYLDIEALDACLHPGRVQRGGLYMRLLFLLDTEAWIDHWLSARSPDEASHH